MSLKTNSSTKNSLIGAAVLAIFALTATALVAFTFENTKERIEENEKAMLLKGLHEIMPPDTHDNDVYNDFITVQAAGLGYRGDLATIYRVRNNGKPVGAILNVVAPDGYGGPIKMLVGIHYNGEIAGVRVISHKETPGLGDAIETRKSDWIHGFEGRSLGDPVEKRWAVKKDSGVFDQFTGATITPRAVVKAVYKALKYFEQYRDQIFSAPSETRDDA